MTSSQSSSSPVGKPKGPRSMARLWAVKALFQYDQTDCSLSDVLSDMKTRWISSDDLFDDVVYNAVDEELFEALVQSTMVHREVIDAELQPLLPPEWTWERLDPVMRSILRTGCGEACLAHPPPPGVLINEYVDIAAAFSGPSGAGFINRILDQVSKKIKIQKD